MGLKMRVMGDDEGARGRPWMATSCQTWSFVIRSRPPAASTSSILEEEFRLVQENCISTKRTIRSVLEMFFTAFVDKKFDCKDTKCF